MRTREQVGDDPIGVGGVELAGEAGVVAAQVAAEGAAAGDGEDAAATAGPGRAVNRHPDVDEPLVLADRPRLVRWARVSRLSRSKPSSVRQSTSIARTRRSSSSRIRHSSSRCSAADPVEQVGARPGLVVGGDLGQVAVVTIEQAGLLEVGHRDPPAALQVDVELVLDDRAQGALGVLLGAELGVRAPARSPHLQAQGVGDRRRDVLVGRARRRPASASAA